MDTPNNISPFRWGIHVEIQGGYTGIYNFVYYRSTNSTLIFSRWLTKVNPKGAKIFLTSRLVGYVSVPWSVFLWFNARSQPFFGSFISSKAQKHVKHLSDFQQRNISLQVYPFNI